MKAVPSLRRIAAASVVLLATAAGAQPGMPEPGPRSGSHGGIGIQLDIGALWRTLGARSAAAQDESSLPGQIVGVFDADAMPDPNTVAAMVRAERVLAQRLETLDLALLLLEVAPDRTQTVLQQLRERYPDAVFDRHRQYTAQEAPTASGRQPVRYATRLIAAPDEPPRLEAAVRIGIIDGIPDPTLGLDVASLTLFPMAETPSGAEHATAVACLLACAPETGAPGLARGAHLLFAAVLATDRAGRTVSNTYTVARALDVLVSRRVDLVHMSLGTTADAVLGRVVQRVLPKVRGFVAAGGNRGPEGPAPFPASHPGVVAVAAVDADAKPWRSGTRGPHIAMAAPGVDLWLPVGGGRYFTGTSFAAPFVTAALAVRAARGQSTHASDLCAEAIDLPPTGRDDASGCGLLQWPATHRH
ncbi:MAG: S8 family serine peptidase [Caldimonas manganoxidans]|nr:S8 family serine peptidase [Caldimonas manganoxidans]